MSTEVRYIPADAIASATEAPPLAAPATTVTSQSFTNPGRTPLANAPTVGDDPLWAQAEQAEQRGDRAGAIQLYELLAQRVRETNNPLAVRAWNRIQTLRASAPPATQTPASTTTARTSTAGDDAAHTVRLTSPVTNNSQPGTSARNWYGPGRVYRTTFKVEGRPAYRVEPGNGQMWFYVTPCVGVELEPFVNREIYVYGQLTYHGELRTYYMPVMQVSLYR